MISMSGYSIWNRHNGGLSGLTQQLDPRDSSCASILACCILTFHEYENASLLEKYKHRQRCILTYRDYVLRDDLWGAYLIVYKRTGRCSDMQWLCSFKTGPALSSRKRFLGLSLVLRLAGWLKDMAFRLWWNKPESFVNIFLSHRAWSGMKIGSFGQDWLDIALFGPSGCVGVWIGHLKAKPCSLVVSPFGVVRSL